MTAKYTFDLTEKEQLGEAMQFPIENVQVNGKINEPSISPVQVDVSPIIDKKQQLLDKILATRFDDTTSVKAMPVAITIAGSTFARRGDFSVVMGQRKAGKTTILHYMIATALHNPDSAELADTLQIKTTYCEGKDVIYIDNEGTQQDTKDFIEEVKRILGIDRMPKNFYVYHWRNMTQKECREATQVLFDHHKSSHLWIIDGIADLVVNPNEVAESNETVRWVMNNAGRLDTCFVLIIHENPQKQGIETKARGHLGSELERKASGAIGIEKDKEKKVHYIKPRFLRKSADFEPVCFWWENGHPISRVLTEVEKTQLFQKGYERIQDLRLLLKQCFLGVSTKAEKELKASVELYQPASPSKEAARKKRDRNIMAMIEHKLLLVETDEQGTTVYRPIPEPQPEQLALDMD